MTSTTASTTRAGEPHAFIEMVSSSDYQAISFHRTAALADSRLIGTRTGIDLLASRTE